MIQIQNLSKSYGGQILFKKINLQMNPGERIGLVGRNGHGKSTLFRIITGEEEADEGKVLVPRGYKVGFLTQHLRFTQETLLAEASLGLAEEERDQLYRVETILFGLGFTPDDLLKSPLHFSGGYQIRIELTKTLLADPNLLLLDEPTNYLDLPSIRWMIKFLRSWKNELILISHDRDFMDQVTTHTAAIHRQQLKKISGGTEKIYAQILQEEEIHEKTRANQEKKRKQEEEFIERFRAKASKATAVQSRIKKLEKMPNLEKLAAIEHLDFSFHAAPFEAERVLQVRDLSFHYDHSPPLIADLSFTLKAGSRLAIIGKNGKGKSTLLNLLAGELEPRGGEVYLHPNVQMGYFGQTNIQRLQPQMTIEQEVLSANTNLTRTEVRNICGTLMFSGDAAEKKVGFLSGGEKSRVLLAKILAKPANLLLLDEPTNHLDIESIEALLESLEDFPGAVVIVTHSELILKRLATQLVLFRKGGAEFFDGTYEDFLERIGWEEEGRRPDGLSSEDSSSKNPNKKELRQKRSEILSEKSRALSPLKKKMESLEREIPMLEQDLATLQSQLIEASQNQKGSEVGELSKKIKSLKLQIDQKYTKLESAIQEHDDKQRSFDLLLQEVE